MNVQTPSNIRMTSDSVTFHRDAGRIVCVNISSAEEITGHNILTTISPSVVAVVSRLNGPLIPCHINS